MRSPRCPASSVQVRKDRWRARGVCSQSAWSDAAGRVPGSWRPGLAKQPRLYGMPSRGQRSKPSSGSLRPGDVVHDSGKSRGEFGLLIARNRLYDPGGSQLLSSPSFSPPSEHLRGTRSFHGLGGFRSHHRPQRGSGGPILRPPRASARRSSSNRPKLP